MNMCEYRDDLHEMSYLIGKALDCIPYGAPTDIQTEIDDVEIDLQFIQSSIGKLLNTIQENN